MLALATHVREGIEEQVLTCIEELTSVDGEGIPPERVFVCGYSQGGAMAPLSALAWMMKKQEPEGKDENAIVARLGGAACFAGWWLLESQMAMEAAGFGLG